MYWKSPVTVALLLSLALGGAALADDRDLLRDSSGSPYIFIVLDTSGSMHWAPVCTEADAGCRPVDKDEDGTIDDYSCDIDPWDGACTQECTLPEAECQRICPDMGCVEYALDYDAGNAPEVEEIIIDNTDSTGVDIVGTWFVGGLQPWVGTDYVHNNRQGQGSKSIRFTPDILKAGTYHVYLHWSSNNSRASNVPVDVTHVGGTDTVKLNQTRSIPDFVDEANGFRYNLVGTYEFDAGTAGNVLIRTDDTTGYVAVDSIRFVSYVEPSPSLTCLRTGYRCQQELCPRGDCYSPLNGDDPRSKFYQAKQALFEVIESTADIHFGLGSYEQDNGRLMAKHWLYRVREFKPTPDFPADTTQDFFWDNTPKPFPGVDNAYVFGNGAPYNSNNGNGDGWNCASFGNYPGKFDSGGNLDAEGDAGRVGCFFNEPADWDNPWEMERFRRTPKLGLDGDVDTTLWLRRDGTTYRVVFKRVLKSDGTPYKYSDPFIPVNIERTNCSSSSCSGGTTVTKTVYLDLVSDYGAWDLDLQRFPMRGGGFFDNDRTLDAGNTCSGLEPNDDTDANVDPSIGFSNDDTWWDYAFKWPTSLDPRGDSLVDVDGNALPRVDWFDTGDFVPLDWTATNRQIILDRLAPNLVSGGTAPDFRTAVYWQDEYLSASDPNDENNRRLRLKDEAKRPFLSYGSTPIGASLRDFRIWYAGLDNTPDEGGWSGVAAERDLDWACRQKYVLFLTDGNETCGGDPCDAAGQLRDEGVRTYVVGFGLDDNSSNLGCIAERGGTNKPILPRNKDELVQALEDILQQIRAEQRSFASASIPAIQSSAADKILLSSFIPLPSSAIWPGQVDMFRKPLPLRDGRPDTQRKCSGTVQAACHLFDLGEKLLEQVPDTLLPTTPGLGMGSGESQRRVIYGQENLSATVPNPLYLFRQPYRGADGTDVAILEDLGDVLVEPDVMTEYYDDKFNPVPPLVTADDIEDDIVDVMVEILAEKELDLDEDPRDAYVLGDVFHANPVVISGPSNLTYFSNDLCGRIKAEPNNCAPDEDRGYRAFTEQHVWRRLMLMTATNDGQLHFFDVGTRAVRELEVTESRREPVEVFTDGTGQELFSYMPRLTLPVVRDQVNDQRHVFSVDGNLSIADVFIDPVHSLSGARPMDREWRTVVMAGLREAGDKFELADGVSDFVSGYFALDVTQPDVIDKEVEVSGETFDFVPVNSGFQSGTDDLPSCLSLRYSTDGRQQVPADAGDDFVSCRYPFPAELWSFVDRLPGTGAFLDEEDSGDPSNPGNGERDLGDTWSRPVIGQIAVYEDGNPTTKHVAIFGGGLDPKNKELPQRGTFLYMVDVETGQAIYKRELDGAVPSDPAVLDVDRDGIFDRIYIGTTAGTLYKVDLAAELPSIVSVNVRRRLLPDPGDGQPILVDRIDESKWKPFPILESDDGIPFYYPPTTFFIPELNKYGLTAGTGDREDLWQQTDLEGRLYVFVDEELSASDPTTGRCTERLPITSACLENIAFDADPPVISGTEDIDNSIDYLTAPFDGDGDPSAALRPGWVMTLPRNFRLTAEPFLVSGVLIFSQFQPIAFIPEDPTDPNDPNPPPPPPPNTPEPVVCARTGITRSFVVLARNANPVARLSGDPQATDPDVDGTVLGDGDGPADDGGETSGALKSRDRYHKIGEFTTAPFIDRKGSKNAPVPGGGGATIDDLVDAKLRSEVQKVVMESYPRGSRFNDAYEILIAALRNSTGVNVYAPIPIAVYPADWKEQQ